MAARQPLLPGDIRKWPRFSGKDSEWEEWAFATHAAITDLGWGDLLDGARAMQDPIDIVDLNPEFTQLSRNMFSLLAQSTRGKAQTLARLQADGNGFEVWRLLWREYRPTGAEPAHAQLSAIIQPRWWFSADHRGRPFMDILLDWEQLVAAYELASGEVISNNTKCATVLGWAPQVVESMLRSSDGETRADYQRMKASIRDRQIGQRGASFYVPPAPSTAMDVDAVASGTVGGKDGKRGKGAGGAEKKCSHCGKKGHLATECWQLVGRPEGPKGGKGREGKVGKKGGKAGGGADRPQKQCTYCGKKGHEESDCWAKKRGDKPGGAGPESGQPDAGAARQVSMGPASSSHDYSGFMCMAATLDVRAVERQEDKTFVLVDGGSDLHLAPASMANDQLTPTTVTARDVRKQPIPLAGEQVCPFVMTRDDDEPALGAAKFLLSDTVKEPLLSTGLLHDGGYDVVYSQQHGCFLGRGASMSITFGDDYVRVPMSRRTNTYGLDVLMADTPAEAWELAEGFRVAPAELAGTPAPSRPVRGRDNFLRIGRRRTSCNRWNRPERNSLSTGKRTQAGWYGRRARPAGRGNRTTRTRCRWGQPRCWAPTHDSERSRRASGSWGRPSTDPRRCSGRGCRLPSAAWQSVVRSSRPSSSVRGSAWGARPRRTSGRPPECQSRRSRSANCTS